MPRRRKSTGVSDSPLPPGMHELAVLPLINTVIYPHVVSPLYVSRESALRAVEDAHTRNQGMLVVAQKGCRQGSGGA